MKSADQSRKFVFVCYSRMDNEVVDRVIAELEKRGHSMWIDRAGIVGSQTWRARIVEAMQQCRAVLFFGSRASYGSRHVATELTLAEEAHKPIIPVLIDDAPPDGDIRYFLARLHHLKLFGSDRASAIEAIHHALLRIGDSSAISGSPLPRPARHRISRALIAPLGLLMLAAAAWFLSNYYPLRVGKNPTPQQAQVKVPDDSVKEEKDNEEKKEEAKPPPDQELPNEPGKPTIPQASNRPDDAPAYVDTAQTQNPPTHPADGDAVADADADQLVVGAEAEVIMAIQRGILTSETGGVLQLSVDFDIDQTVRIEGETQERIKLGSTKPGMGTGWIKKIDARRYLKPKPRPQLPISETPNTQTPNR